MATVPPTASNASATIPMRQVVPSATSLASSRPVIPRDCCPRCTGPSHQPARATTSPRRGRPSPSRANRPAPHPVGRPVWARGHRPHPGAASGSRFSLATVAHLRGLGHRHRTGTAGRVGPRLPAVRKALPAQPETGMPGPRPGWHPPLRPPATRTRTAPQHPTHPMHLPTVLTAATPMLTTEKLRQPSPASIRPACCGRSARWVRHRPFSPSARTRRKSRMHRGSTSSAIPLPPPRPRPRTTRTDGWPLVHEGRLRHTRRSTSRSAG